jgi:iron complex transport system ATP-binding protein
VIDAVGLRFAYERRGKVVLDDVSVQVRRGTILGLLGPNGSGKTTLLKLLSGTLTPQRGTVSIDGHALSTLSRREIAKQIAVVPQETHSAFDFSALEIVLMGRYPHLGALEIEGAADLSIAREAMAATGTAALAARPFATLSGGEKQRVVIAGALAQASEVLLLDEPTASLDVGYQFEVTSMLRRLNRDRGVTLVVSTHDLNLAAALCTEQALLHDGRLLAHGPLADVLTPAHIRSLYRIDAEVAVHPRAGHLTVIPVARCE